MGNSKLEDIKDFIAERRPTVFGIILFIATNIVSLIYSPWDINTDSALGSVVYSLSLGGVADLMQFMYYIVRSPEYNTVGVDIIYAFIVSAVFAYIWIITKLIKKSEVERDVFAYTNLIMYVTCILSYHIFLPLGKKLTDNFYDMNFLLCLAVILLFGLFVILPSYVSIIRIRMCEIIILNLVHFFAELSGDNMALSIILLIVLFIIVCILDELYECLLMLITELFVTHIKKLLPIAVGISFVYSAKFLMTLRLDL